MTGVVGDALSALRQRYPERFEVVVEVPGVPVSVNKLYSVFRGKKSLSKAGKAFRDKLASEIARSSTDWKRAVDMVYTMGGLAELFIEVYFDDLKNASWVPGGITESGSPQNPVRRRDASNYIKITEDAVAMGSGIDDCNNATTVVSRMHDPSNPRTVVTYVVHL